MNWGEMTPMFCFFLRESMNGDRSLQMGLSVGMCAREVF